MTAMEYGKVIPLSTSFYTPEGSSNFCEAKSL